MPPLQGALLNVLLDRKYEIDYRFYRRKGELLWITERPHRKFWTRSAEARISSPPHTVQPGSVLSLQTTARQTRQPLKMWRE